MRFNKCWRCQLCGSLVIVGHERRVSCCVLIFYICSKWHLYAFVKPAFLSSIFLLLPPSSILLLLTSTPTHPSPTPTSSSSSYSSYSSSSRFLTGHSSLSLIQQKLQPTLTVPLTSPHHQCRPRYHYSCRCIAVKVYEQKHQQNLDPHPSSAVADTDTDTACGPVVLLPCCPVLLLSGCPARLRHDPLVLLAACGACHGKSVALLVQNMRTANTGKYSHCVSSTCFDDRLVVLPPNGFRLFLFITRCHIQGTLSRTHWSGWASGRGGTTPSPPL